MWASFREAFLQGASSEGTAHPPNFIYLSKTYSLEAISKKNFPKYYCFMLRAFIAYSCPALISVLADFSESELLFQYWVHLPALE
jgi:hypothetical protein